LSQPILKIIDTHTHLYDPVFDPDRPVVLTKARDAGVHAIISVSEDLKDAEKNLGLARQFPIIHPVAGLYPVITDLTRAASMIEFIRDHQNELVGIGEVGLDYWKVQEESDREIQREIFRQFIVLSNELDIPVNVHSRSAGKYAVAMLLEHDARRVHMHAPDAKPSMALPGVEAGFMFSIPPSVIRSRQKQKFVRRIPLDNLMIETDSPVLGPEPDVRNEPANAALVVDAIAEIKGKSREEVLDTTYQNTLKLYSKLKIQV